MEMRQLESLVAIADGGSFSRAAVMLNLAQPSLSRQMALLERDCRTVCEWFTRRGHPVDAGELFALAVGEFA